MGWQIAVKSFSIIFISVFSGSSGADRQTDRRGNFNRAAPHAP